MSAANSFDTWEEAVRWLREQPDRQQLVHDAYYDDPLHEAAQRYWQSEEWAAIRALLTGARGRALDVGAGRGIATYALAREGYRVTALEPDASALVGAEAIRSLAAESQLPIDVTQEFSERLPFEAGHFDLVFARAVLHHTRDLSAACQEFLRVLKPGGVLIAVREHVISRPEDLAAFLANHPLHKLYGGENAFMLDQYCRALTGAGFELQSVLAPLASPINYAPYTLESLQSELADRVGRHVPGCGALVRTCLRLPGVWPVVRALLGRVDHRPGRLYSFIARRP